MADINKLAPIPMNIQLEIKQLRIQSRLLKKMIYSISAQEIGYTELTSVIGPILTLNQTTLQSAILLSQKKHYRDLIILSRPFLESVINVGFICAELTLMTYYRTVSL